MLRHESPPTPLLDPPVADGHAAVHAGGEVEVVRLDKRGETAPV